MRRCKLCTAAVQKVGRTPVRLALLLVMPFNSKPGSGRKRRKDNKGYVFFEFLEEEFGSDYFEGGILDVAGGQGLMTYIFNKKGFKCTLIDPRSVVSCFQC